MANTGTRALVWVARIWSVASIAFVLVFVIAEASSSPRVSPIAREWIGLSLWPIGVCLGLLIAWFREGVGGTIGTLCLILFYVWYWLDRGRIPGGPFFILVAAPALLFLVSALISRPSQSIRAT